MTVKIVNAHTAWTRQKAHREELERIIASHGETWTDEQIENARWITGGKWRTHPTATDVLTIEEWEQRKWPNHDPTVLPINRAVFGVSDDGLSFVEREGSAVRDVVPVMCHAGNLPYHYIAGNRSLALRALDDIQEAGYEGYAGWTCLNVPDRANDYWPTFGPLHTPGYWDGVDALLDETERRGLRIDAAQGDLMGVSNAVENDIVQNWAARFHARPHLCHMYEMLNEARDTGDPDDREPGELVRLAQIARSIAPEILVALTAYTGTEDRAILNRYTPEWMQFFVYHQERQGRVHDHWRHARTMGYDGEATLVRHLGMNAEPPGPGASAMWSSTQREYQEPHAAPMLAAATTVAGHLFTFHSGVGVKLETGRFRDVPGFGGVPKIVRLIRETFPDILRWRTMTHGGERWRDVSPIGDPDPYVTGWRADSRLSGSRGLGIAYGPADNGVVNPIRIRRDMRVQFVDAAVQEVITDRRVDAGELVAVKPWTVLLMTEIA